MSKTITIPEELYEKLGREAQARGLTIEGLLEQVGRSLSLTSPCPEEILETLRQGGLSPLTLDPFSDLIDPTVDYETVRRELADRTFTPNLSEIIIADRG
ncbi:MAG: hypothetical protein HYS70_00670 [Nitrospinae bacterium]|nr:hypothetical protein [Nitrospinota bacterium]